MSDTLQFVEPWIKGGQNTTLMFDTLKKAMNKLLSTLRVEDTLIRASFSEKKVVVFNQTTN